MSIDTGGSTATTAGGYTADSDVLFQASTRFLDTKNYLYAIAAGLAGDLAKSRGMAGDDTTAHNFATKYEPAARTIVKGIGNAGEASATIASRLLGMAVNYLNIEDSLARAFTGAIDAASPLARSQEECEPSEEYLALPMVTGSKEVNEIPVIGRFWPQGNPDVLREVAQIWAKAADLVDDAQRNAGQHEEPVRTYCHGEAVDKFVAFGRTLYNAHPSGGTSVSNGAPLMENLSAACRQMSQVCTNYADHIEHTRHVILALAATVVVVTAAGVALTLFTLGGSDAAAAAVDTAVVADAAAAATALEATVAADAAAVALAAELPVIEAELAQLAAVGAIAETEAAASSLPMAAGFALAVGTGTGVLLSSSDAQAASPASMPPVPGIPPRVPPAFPLYDPTRLAAAQAWDATLPTRDPMYGTPEDQAYQIRMAGAPERLVTGANGETVWADGYRPTDGALVDAKHVRQLGCSARTLDGLNEGSFGTSLMLTGDDDELRRYGGAISNPQNQAQFLEIDTNDRATVGYWQFLAARNHVPNDVRYEK